MQSGPIGPGTWSSSQYMSNCLVVHFLGKNLELGISEDDPMWYALAYKVTAYSRKNKNKMGYPF